MSEFGRERTKEGKPDGRYCVACKLEQQRKWRAANQESVRKSRQKYNEKRSKDEARDIREQAS